MSDDIRNGRTSLGIELGSTRIKACLIGSNATEVLATGGHAWENRLENGLWTYSLDDVWAGVQAAYAGLVADAQRRHGVRPETFGAIGVSAMMHGYLAFDAEGELLTPFRTWRNTSTGEAAAELTELFGVNIPLRWSIAHLHQAVRDEEEHVERLDFVTTLAGYVHFRLTGRRVLGVGDASGMFPIGPGTRGAGTRDSRARGSETYGSDAYGSETGGSETRGLETRGSESGSETRGSERYGAETYDYDARMIAAYDARAGRALPAPVTSLLPEVLAAGAEAGTLTEEGAALLDPSCTLRPGIPLCPPEGDAGTGMVATNSVAPRTGNVSAGTSIFAMVVLERPLRRVHHELDLVTTPAGDAVAMVHCNNGASELGAWVGLFSRFADVFGREIDDEAVNDDAVNQDAVNDDAVNDDAVNHDAVFEALFREALAGEPDAGGLIAYNHLAGEPVAGLTDGVPLFVRTPGSDFSLANFMRSQIYGVFGTLALGMRALADEGVAIDRMFAHGGLFRTAGVAQRFLAGALDAPVAVGELAAEGGAWGIAVLGSYLAKAGETSLGAYLDDEVFHSAELIRVEPDPADVAGFSAYLDRYQAGLAIEAIAPRTIDPTGAMTVRQEP